MVKGLDISLGIVFVDRDFGFVNDLVGLCGYTVLNETYWHVSSLGICAGVVGTSASHELEDD